MEKIKLVNYIIGPDGRYINQDNLPQGANSDWTLDDKASIVFALEGGLISPREVMGRYGLHRNELKDWCKIVDFYFGTTGRVLGINPQKFARGTLGIMSPSAASN